MEKQNRWPATAPKNIIIRMPNWLGDLVMATPLLDDLRAHFPEARITAMCQSNTATLLEKDRAIDEVLSFKKPSGWIHNRHLDFVQSLRYGNYDLGILTTNSFSSAWWFWLGKVKNRIGYAANMRSLLLNKAVPYPEKKESQHLVITYKMLLLQLGIPISNAAPRLCLTDEELSLAKEILANQGAVVGQHTIIGVNPGAAYGSAKCWPPERFVEVAKLLLNDPQTYVVFFGDPTGAPLVNRICQEVNSPRVINMAAKTSLRELLALISSCTAMLSNDSGPMHISAALKVPLVAIFGSTSDVKTGPYRHGTVIHKHVECSPCYKRVCPIDFRCMTRISAEEVYREILTVVQQGKGTPGKLPVINM